MNHVTGESKALFALPALLQDRDGDGLPDVVVGNKKGAFVFLHEIKHVSREEWEQAQPKPYSAGQ